MDKYLSDLDSIELIIQAGQYFKIKKGKALDLRLTGFDLDLVKYSPEEAENYSDIIGDFRCNCHDEYVHTHGSYEEFSESYSIKIRAILLERGILESDNFNEQKK